MSPPPAEGQYGQDSFEDYEDDFSDADHSDEDQMAGRSGLGSSWPDPFDEGTEESGSGGEYQSGSSLETPTARSLNNPSCLQPDSPLVSLSQDVSLPLQQQVSYDIDRSSASNPERRVLEMKEILVLAEHLEPLVHSTLDSVIESALVSIEVSDAGLLEQELVTYPSPHRESSTASPHTYNDEQRIRQMKEQHPLEEDLKPLVDSTLNSIIDSALLSRQVSESGFADTVQVSSPIPPDDSPTIAPGCQQDEQVVPEIWILQAGLHGADRFHPSPTAVASDLVRTTRLPPRQNSLDEQEAILAAAVAIDISSFAHEEDCLDATLDFTAELDEHSFLEESRMPQEKQDLLLSCSSLNFTLAQELSGSEFRETDVSQDIARCNQTAEVQSVTSIIDASSDNYADTVKLDWSLTPCQLEVGSACSNSICGQSKHDNTATDLAPLLFEALDRTVTAPATNACESVAELAMNEVEQILENTLTHLSSKGTDVKGQDQNISHLEGVFPACSASLSQGHQPTNTQDPNEVIQEPLPVPLIAEDTASSNSSQFAQQPHHNLNNTSVETCLNAQISPDLQQSSTGALFPEHDPLKADDLESIPLANELVCPASSEEPSPAKGLFGQNSSSQPHTNYETAKQAENPLPESSEKPPLVELKETFAEACRGGAAVGVGDLLADLQDELLGTSIGQEYDDEEDGGFFISNGGGGLNLQLGDDFDDEDLTEATRRVYLTALPAKAAYPSLPSSEEVLVKGNEAPVEPEIHSSGHGHAIQNPPEVIRATTDACRSTEVEVLLRAKLVAKEAIMNSVLKAVLQLQALSMEMQLASLRASEPPKDTELSQVGPEEDTTHNHAEVESFTDVAYDEHPNGNDALPFEEVQLEPVTGRPIEQVKEVVAPCDEEDSLPADHQGTQGPVIEQKVVQATNQREQRGSTAAKLKRLSTAQKSQPPPAVKAARGNSSAERVLVPRRPEAPRSTRPSPRTSIQAAASRSAMNSNQNIKREQRLPGRIQTQKSSKAPEETSQTAPMPALPEEPPPETKDECEAAKEAAPDPEIPFDASEQADPFYFIEQPEVQYLEQPLADADGAFAFEVADAEFQYQLDGGVFTQASDLPNQQLDFTFSAPVPGNYPEMTADDLLLYQQQQMFLYQQQQLMMYQQEQHQMLWQQQLYQQQTSGAPFDQPSDQLQRWQMEQLQQWQMAQMQMQQFSQHMPQGSTSYQPTEFPDPVSGGSSPSLKGSKPPKPTLKGPMGSRTKGLLAYSRTASLTCIDQQEQNEETSEVAKGTSCLESAEQQDEKAGIKSSQGAGDKVSQLPRNKKGTTKKEKHKSKDTTPWKNLLFLPLDSSQAQRSVCSLSSYSSVATLHRILVGGRNGDSQLRGRSEDSLLDWSTVTPCVPTSTDGTKAQEDFESATSFHGPNFPWPDEADSEEMQDQQLQHARSVGGSAFHAARNLRGDLEGDMPRIPTSRQLSLPASKLSEASKVKGQSPRHFSLETRNRRRLHS